MTPEQKLEVARLLALPWTFHTRRNDDGDLLVEIAELPEFVASADSVAEVDAAAWDSLRSLLSAYVEVGDPVPEPTRRSVVPTATPWLPLKVWDFGFRTSHTPLSGLAIADD